MRYRPETFDELLRLYRQKTYSLRQLITYTKSDFKDDAIAKTSFLPKSCDLIERLYYIVNDIKEQVKCQVCGKPASWTGRINEGYYDTCGAKECVSVVLNKVNTGSTKISENRDAAFVEAQSKVFVVSDQVVKDLVKYDRQLDLITNTAIAYYLDQRFSDSYSRLETLQRIRLGIEEKPKCPMCGKPVKFVGKPKKMFTTYCCEKCAATSSEVKEKKAQAQLENWGERCCYNSEKYKLLCKEKYGVEYHWQRADIRKKCKDTIMSKYGVEYASQSEDIKAKIWETCKQHQTFATSNEEEDLYSYLQTIFPDIIHHYKSDAYPFNCDFYVPSLDLYIEYQGSLFHNGCAFLNTPEQQKELQRLMCKNDERSKDIGKPSRYQSIIDTWTKYDVVKRKYATDNKLNFLEIFRFDNYEQVHTQIEFYVHCLNKTNFYHYSEDVLRKEFEMFKGLKNCTLSSTFLYNRIVKQFQCCNFYKHEMEIYANNPILRRKLIQNRVKYLGKSENELTPDELIGGFKKSGIFYGYSHFNPRWANWFINKYDVKRVYDPCGGWGHHLLGMLQCEKIVYNDLSVSTVNSIREMKDYFNIDNLDIHCEDARTYVPENVDAFFMCPPYCNLEHYDCGDFSDESDYEKFLNDIFNIWHKNTAEVFGVILREDLAQYIKERPAEVFELKTSKSHLSKNKNLKENLYVFRK